MKKMFLRSVVIAIATVGIGTTSASALQFGYDSFHFG